eukprot:SAG11_NODE_1570_length_4660_cov_6.671991_1_plen_64_part_00
MIKKQYTTDEWTQRIELIKAKGSPKDHPNLYKNDKYIDPQGKSHPVCFGCRKFGHTWDKCNKA